MGSNLSVWRLRGSVPKVVSDKNNSGLIHVLMFSSEPAPSKKQRLLQSAAKTQNTAKSRALSKSKLKQLFGVLRSWKCGIVFTNRLTTVCGKKKGGKFILLMLDSEQRWMAPV